MTDGACCYRQAPRRYRVGGVLARPHTCTAFRRMECRKMRVLKTIVPVGLMALLTGCGGGSGQMTIATMNPDAGSSGTGGTGGGSGGGTLLNVNDTDGGVVGV